MIWADRTKYMGHLPHYVDIMQDPAIRPRKSVREVSVIEMQPHLKIC